MRERGREWAERWHEASPRPRRGPGYGKKVVPYEEFLRRRRSRHHWGTPSPGWRWGRIGARELWERGETSWPGEEDGSRRSFRVRTEPPKESNIPGKPSSSAFGSTFSPRRAERSSRESAGKRMVARLSVGLLLLVSLVALAWVYFFSGMVSVRRFEVWGAKELEPGYIVALSGIREGTNLFRVDTEGARETLLTEPRIREAVVKRKFPDTVVLQVKEREPLACLPQNGLFFLVDGEGMVYASCEQKPQGAVELRLSPAPTLYAGRELDDLGARQVLEALKGAPGLAAMAEAAGREERGIYLNCQGVKVILGDVQDLQRKESIALGALKTAAARGEVLDYVDVRLPEHPVWKPRG